MIEENFPDYTYEFTRDKGNTGSLEITVSGILIHSKLAGDGNIIPSNNKINDVIDKIKEIRAN